MGYDPLNETTAGRPCALKTGRCPGCTKGCAFWRKQEVSLGGKTTVVENCLFVLQFECSYQGVAEQIRTQSTINLLNNQAFVSMVALSKGLKMRALSGRPDPDKKSIEGVIDAPEG